MVPEKIKFQSIEWHRENIHNREKSLAKLQEQFENIRRRIEIDSSELDFYKSQVRAAVEKGKTKFDADKFGKKKEKKSFTLMDAADASYYKGFIRKYAKNNIVNVSIESEDKYKLSWIGPDFNEIMEKEEK